MSRDGRSGAIEGMTQDQANIRTIFDTTIDYLDANIATWTGTPAFADAVSRAKTAVAAIDTAVDKQQTRR